MMVISIETPESDFKGIFLPGSQTRYCKSFFPINYQAR